MTGSHNPHETWMCAELQSPIGPLLVVASSRGVRSIAFSSYADWNEPFAAKEQLVEGDTPNGVLARTVSQLESYFAGRLTVFDVPLDLHGTPFQLRVWKALCTVPYGETASYKTIAERIDSPKAVRAVGGANNRNPVPIIVPCHRIIGANGTLVGYGGGLSIKEHLLALERQEQGQIPV